MQQSVTDVCRSHMKRGTNGQASCSVERQGVAQGPREMCFHSTTVPHQNVHALSPVFTLSPARDSFLPSSRVHLCKGDRSFSQGFHSPESSLICQKSLERHSVIFCIPLVCSASSLPNAVLSFLLKSGSKVTASRKPSQIYSPPPSLIIQLLSPSRAHAVLCSVQIESLSTCCYVVKTTDSLCFI